MRKFSSRLQSSLSVDDREWVFDVLDIPHEDELDQAGLVKYIFFATSSTQWEIVLSLELPGAICEFSSKECYKGKLKTAETAGTEPFPSSSFSWPTIATGIHCQRKVLVQCSDWEDIEHRSKGNAGQANLTKEIYRRLETHSGKDTQSDREAKKRSIVILTPHTRQRDMIKAKIPGVEVASIDSFQGKEADIIIFVTVRCNVKGDLGLLKDMRRLNVALTRAQAGLIVVGDRSTLTHASEDNSNAVWRKLLDWLPIVTVKD